MKLGKIVINHEGCKGCRYCVYSCPRELISINTEQINILGYNPAHFKNNPDKPCVGCSLCAEICPDVMIEVYREKKGEKKEHA